MQTLAILMSFFDGYGGNRIFSYPIGSMYAIYGNMDPINIPQYLAYIPAPWIVWVLEADIQTRSIW